MSSICHLRCLHCQWVICEDCLSPGITLINDSPLWINSANLDATNNSTYSPQINYFNIWTHGFEVHWFHCGITSICVTGGYDSKEEGSSCGVFREVIRWKITFKNVLKATIESGSDEARFSTSNMGIWINIQFILYIINMGRISEYGAAYLYKWHVPLIPSFGALSLHHSCSDEITTITKAYFAPSCHHLRNDTNPVGPWATKWCDEVLSNFLPHLHVGYMVSYDWELQEWNII